MNEFSSAMMFAERNKHLITYVLHCKSKNYLKPIGSKTRMIQNSFIFLDKISSKTEERLWEQGIVNWNIFLRQHGIEGISPSRKLFYDTQLLKAREELFRNNAPFFAKILPSGEVWRLYDFFSEEACFLDIETSGYYGDITVVGLYDGFETKMFVKGFNLDLKRLAEVLKNYKMIVTFNGSSFDLPVIERYCKNTIPGIPHLDLRHACSKLGLTGGLKKIERDLGIKRDESVNEMSGSEAVYLWNMWIATKNQKYLDLLIKYNEEDIMNLKPIADYCYKHLKHKVYQQRILKAQECKRIFHGVA